MTQQKSFGLHENAEISSAINDTNQLLLTALSLQPRSGGTGGQSGDQIIKEKCANILAKLPKPFDMDDAIKRHPVKYEEVNEHCASTRTLEIQPPGTDCNIITPTAR